MYQRILVPVDGSATSDQALDAAVRLAKQSSGRIRLLHVVDELAYLNGYDQYGGYSAELITAMKENGARVLNQAMTLVQAAGVPVDNMLFDNFGERLGENVAEMATRWNADLIVVGTHGRRGVGRLLLGSGAEEVIRLAPVPVLVVRATGTEASPVRSPATRQPA